METETVVLERRPVPPLHPRRMVLAAVVLASVAVAAFPGAAHAAVAGPQRFVVVSAGAPGAARTVYAAGVMNAVGTETILSNPAGVATLRWTFPEGTLHVTGHYSFQSHLDPQTCLRTITLNGTWQITSGTGRFAGASGGGTFSGTNRILLTRTGEGACVPPPVFLAQVFDFNGTVMLA